MIDYDVLDKFGTHSLRLEAVFTAESEDELNAVGKKVYTEKYLDEEDSKPSVSESDFAKKLYASRKKWERRIKDRIDDGRTLSMKHYRMYMASDLAFDGTPVTPEKFAHMLYAKGDYKNLKDLCSTVKSACGNEVAEQMFVRDKDTPHNIEKVDIPKLTDFTINLVRPYVRRAVAAQVNRYENMYPFLRYESRSQGMIGKLRADLLSERVEVMTDQFNYRHLLGQEIRGMFLHSHSVSFVENSWYARRQMSMVEDEPQERVEKEGVKFKKVHPTRIYYDSAHPLSSINSDEGCSFLGFWDVVKFKDIHRNGRFFNVGSIPVSDTLGNFHSKYSAYFSTYYASTIKTEFDRPTGAEENSRDANSEHSYHNSANDDVNLWLTHHYEKVIPSEEGLGDYPFPVWVHLIIAGDNTVVFAEVLPSRPAYCLSYDENDDRLFNLSMALDILPYQDQVSTLFSQMLYLLQVQSILIFAVDSDVVSDEIRTDLKKIVNGKKLFNRVYMLEFENKVEELFDKTLAQKKPIQLFQTNITNIIDELMGTIGQTIRLLERNQMMSPNEMGQFVERETSATEVQQVSSTSGDLHSYKSSGIDEARQAQKIILYESLVACGVSRQRVATPERYTEDVINHSGFRADESGMYIQEEGEGEGGHNLIGDKQNFVGEFVFNSRDGSERSSNTESAKVLMELMRYFLSSEMLFKVMVETYGMEQITKAISEVFRMAGSPMTLKLPASYTKVDLSSNEEKDVAIKNLIERLTQVEAVAEDYLNQEAAKVPQQAQAQQPLQSPQQFG